MTTCKKWQSSYDDIVVKNGSDYLTYLLTMPKKEEKKADFLLPCELLLLLRKERCPRSCDVGVKVSQCIYCSVVDL